MTDIQCITLVAAVLQHADVAAGKEVRTDETYVEWARNLAAAANKSAP